MILTVHRGIPSGVSFSHTRNGKDSNIALISSLTVTMDLVVQPGAQLVSGFLPEHVGHYAEVEIGIGYVEEIYARLQGHLYDLPPGATQANVTLDEMESTFPLNQTLYFDFSHDTNIMAIITAFGLKQFAQPLPTTGPPANQQLIVSHMTPFAARMVRKSR